MDNAEQQAADAMAAQELNALMARYRSLFGNMLDGYARCHMLFEDGVPIDFEYLEVNRAFEQLTGLHDVVGRRVCEIIPGIRADNPELFEIYGRVARSGIPERFETYLPGLGIWFSVAVYQDGEDRFIALFDNISERKRAEQALSESEARYHSLLDQAADALFVIDLDGRFVDVNRQACEGLGYTREELLAMGALDIDQDYDIDSARTLWQQLEPGQVLTLVTHHRRKDGRSYPVEVRVSCCDVRGRRLIFGLARDISQRRQYEERLHQAATVFESTQDGITITDLEGTIQAVNPAFTTITGYRREEALGKNMRLVRSDRHDRDFYRKLWEDVLSTGSWQGEIWNRRKNGEVFPEWLTINSVCDETGSTVSYVAVFTDITRIKDSEARLQHLAHHDALTDLPNRLLMLSRLDHAIERARRDQTRGAVLFLDLDRFKYVNDSLGHPAGDELLCIVAQRFRVRLRDADTLARLGGDEFVVLLEDIHHPEDAANVAQDLIEQVSQPIRLSGGQSVYLGASVGISLYPDEGLSAHQLIQYADTALYQAKHGGGGTYRFFTEAQGAQVGQRLALEAALRRGLEQDEFVLHYQPQVQLTDGRPVGVEALLRWQPAGQELILPERFIPLAEDTGLILVLGEWVLRQACHQAKAWLEAGVPLRTMAVNLSPRQFRQADLAQRVAAILVETGLPAAHLELELTEGAIMEPGSEAESRLSALKALGVSLAIDDFGTGYSSLSYLKRLPVDKLKIPRDFVLDIPADPADMGIVATIIAMAKTLDLEVLAEGIETAAQQAFMVEHGCDHGQGFLFSQALPAEQIAALFAGR